MKAQIRLRRGKKKEEFNFRLEGADVICEKVPLRFRKAGRVWCGGARETH